MQRYAQQSSDAVGVRSLWLYPTALRSPKSTCPSPSPAQVTARRNLHPPIPFSVLETGSPDPPEPTGLHHDPEYQPDELRSSESNPGCLRRCDACAPSLSCLHRTRRSPLFCRLHALTVDDRCAGALLPPVASSYAVSKSVMDLLPGPVVLPLPEVHINRRVRGKVTGEHAPSAAATQDVEDGVDHRSELCCAWPTSGLRCRQQTYNDPPFRVFEVARVSHTRILARFSGLPKHPLKARHQSAMR
ncbi:MAG: hypothetical protein QOH06_2911 [Acidobacteriota bacterium]|nr:hypothetical protein [Acidobacteriota bacterium]